MNCKHGIDRDRYGCGECDNEALRARIAELEARLALAEKVCEAAESVTWFEYVEDDDDVKDAVEGLRVALAAWREGK